MNTIKTVSNRQIEYLSLLVDQVKEKKLELPFFEIENDMSPSEASQKIKELKSLLGKKITPVINQAKESKDLSNIVIKKEWIVNDNYGKNSILVWIPDITNGQFVEVKLPKGDREVVVDSKNDWESNTTKYVGRLIYNAKNNYYNQNVEHDFLLCGVKLTWKTTYRFIPFDAEPNQIGNLEHGSYEDLIEVFKNAINDYTLEINEKIKNIIHVKKEHMMRRDATDKKNAAKSVKIYREVTIDEQEKIIKKTRSKKPKKNDDPPEDEDYILWDD